MTGYDLAKLKHRMQGALDALAKDFQGLRTGRPSPAMLENLQINAYGSQMQLNQMAAVTVTDTRYLNVQVWDNGVVKDIEKAIAESTLGLIPQTEGQLIRVVVPELSEERRNEIAKSAARFAENAKVAVRNVRREGMDGLSSLKKSGEISEDDMHQQREQLQKITDKFIAAIDTQLQRKQQEVRAV